MVFREVHGAGFMSPIDELVADIKRVTGGEVESPYSAKAIWDYLPKP
jgi:hypothetical protein